MKKILKLAAVMAVCAVLALTALLAGCGGKSLDWNGVYTMADGRYITIEEYDGKGDTSIWFYLNEEGTDLWQNIWNYSAYITDDEGLEAELTGEIYFTLDEDGLYAEFSDPDYYDWEGFYSK